FHLAELNARIKCIIRRKQQDGEMHINLANIIVYPDRHAVYINEEELVLNRKEFDLLYYFVTNPDRLISKGALAESIWGDYIDQADSFDFIYSQVKNLRKKLKSAGATAEIKAVYGFGYKMVNEE
ncbi:winged helix-turn-helix domain-containing protein, partial [Parabacteroides goldsteinii]